MANCVIENPLAQQSTSIEDQAFFDNMLLAGPPPEVL
jgi:hypothetical protein